MILSDIESWDQEKWLFPQVFHRAIEYIRKHDFATISPGKYLIEDELMFALVQEPTTGINNFMESHESYVDLQYLENGEERIGFMRKAENPKIAEQAIEAKDVKMYHHAGIESDIILKPGMFVVFFPNDLHRPCCKVVTALRIKKVVIKIHRRLFFE